MANKETVVDRLFGEFRSLSLFLQEKQEISFQNTADENFKKALLMAAASYFEYRICQIIESFAKNASRENNLVVEFIKNKAISRQYHTYFNWDGGNANSFFALFGSGFKESMKQQVESDSEFANSVKAFLEIGRDRNRLTHQDFGTFPLEKTTEEIYELYNKARNFIEVLPARLKEGLDMVQQGN